MAPWSISKELLAAKPQIPDVCFLVIIIPTCINIVVYESTKIVCILVETVLFNVTPIILDI
jgi:hypothetical protein